MTCRPDPQRQRHPNRERTLITNPTMSSYHEAQPSIEDVKAEVNDLKKHTGGVSACSVLRIECRRAGVDPATSFNMQLAQEKIRVAALQDELLRAKEQNFIVVRASTVCNDCVQPL